MLANLERTLGLIWDVVAGVAVAALIVAAAAAAAAVAAVGKMADAEGFSVRQLTAWGRYSAADVGGEEYSGEEVKLATVQG